MSKDLCQFPTAFRRSSIHLMAFTLITGLSVFAQASTQKFPTSLKNLKLTPIEIVVQTKASDLDPKNGVLSVNPKNEEDRAANEQEFNRFVSDLITTRTAIANIEKLYASVDENSDDAQKMKQALNALKAQVTYFNSFNTQVYAVGERNPLVFIDKDHLAESFTDYKFVLRKDRVEGRTDSPVGYQFIDGSVKNSVSDFGFRPSFTLSSADPDGGHILMIRDRKYRMEYKDFGEAVVLIIKQIKNREMALDIRIQRPNQELGYINLDVVAECSPTKVYSVLFPKTVLEFKLGAPDVFIQCTLPNKQGFLKFKVEGVEVSR